MKQKPIPNSMGKAILYMCIILGFILPIMIVPKLSKTHHAIYAFVYALMCFSAFIFSNKRSYRHDDNTNKVLTMLFWCGVGEGITAVLFWISSYPPRLMAQLMTMSNLGLSLLSNLSVLYIAFSSFFPQLIVKSKSDTKSVVHAGLPHNLQQIMENGRETIQKATMTSLAILISIIAVTMIFLGSFASPFVIIALEILATVLVILLVRYFAIRKWQKRAIQSGIPDKKLKSAAKLTGLPWPKIKEE